MGAHAHAPSTLRWTARTGTTKERIGLVLGPVLFAGTALVPTPPGMAEAAAAAGLPAWAPQFALGVLLWMMTWWLTECVPLGLTGLVAPMAFGTAGVVAWRDALASFMDPIIWIFLAGFSLAAAIGKWGLDRRIAYRLGSMYRGSNPRIAAFFAASLPVFFLTMTGSITGSTTVVYPMVLAFLATLGVDKASRYATGTLLVLGQAATAGAMFLLISTAPNLITKAAIERAAPGATLTFVDWFIVGTPQAVAGLFLSWITVFAIVRPEAKSLPGPKDRFTAALRKLGPMSRGEKRVGIVLLTILALWIVPAVVRAWGSSDPRLVPAAGLMAQLFPEAAPAVLALLVLAIARVDGKPLLPWDEEIRAVDWNVIFLFGGGIALGLGLERSGFASWLGGVAAGWAGAAPSPFAIFVIAALVGFVLTYAASNTAAAIVATSIAASLALGAGVNPIPPILAAGLASSISSAVPSTTPPMAIVYASGRVRMWDMFRSGMASDLLRLGVLITTGPFLADYLCSWRGLG